MNEKSLKLVQQLIEKTEGGLIPWSQGIEDGQFKAILGDGKLAFVVQVKEKIRRFLLLDEHQETILDEVIVEDASIQRVLEASGSEIFTMKLMSGLMGSGAETERARLFVRIGRLQELARSQALKVNEKLAQAEEYLASLS